MAAKTGCILVEKPGHAAPLELIQKIIESNQTCAGVAMSLDGSATLALQPFVELPTAEEWRANREAMSESLCVSWWGSSSQGYDTAEIQPATLLGFEDGSPALVAFTEGMFPTHAKPKTNLGEVYYFHEELRTMIEGLNNDHNGDIGKILEACDGSLFKGWWRQQSAGRAYTVLLAGQLRFITITQGNDKGQVGEWGEVSDAYGWSLTPAVDPNLKGPAAKLAAMAARAKGQSGVVSATTSTEKLVQAGKATVTPGALPKPPATQPTAPASQPGEGESTDGTIYPPDEYVKAWQQARNKDEKQGAQQLIYEWYREHNGGVAPSGFKQFLSHAQNGSSLPGIKAGQQPWKPGEDDGQLKGGSKKDHKAALASIGGGVKGATSNIARATTAQAKTVQAIADNPAYSEERKTALIEKFMSRDTVLDAISFDDKIMITLEDIAKLDRPKASPLSVFADAGITDYDGVRWGKEDWLVLMQTDPAFAADIIQDLRYHYLTLKTQRPPVVQGAPAATADVALTGPAAKVAAMMRNLGKKAG